MQRTNVPVYENGEVNYGIAPIKNPFKQWGRKFKRMITRKTYVEYVNPYENRNPFACNARGGANYGKFSEADLEYPPSLSFDSDNIAGYMSNSSDGSRASSVYSSYHVDDLEHKSSCMSCCCSADIHTGAGPVRTHKQCCQCCNRGLDALEPNHPCFPGNSNEQTQPVYANNMQGYGEYPNPWNGQAQPTYINTAPAPNTWQAGPRIPVNGGMPVGPYQYS